MRIFRNKQKINFVDTNDVLVGFDAEQLCCESFGYFFSMENPQDLGREYKYCYPNFQPANLEELIFDTEFYNRGPGNPETGGFATFRLVAPGKLTGDYSLKNMRRRRVYDGFVNEIFLVLFNHHNGYYSHGFEVTVGGREIKNGYL